MSLKRGERPPWDDRLVNAGAPNPAEERRAKRNSSTVDRYSIDRRGGGGGGGGLRGREEALVMSDIEAGGPASNDEDEPVQGGEKRANVRSQRGNNTRSRGSRRQKQRQRSPDSEEQLMDLEVLRNKLDRCHLRIGMCTQMIW